MTATSTFRGHDMYVKGGDWFYSDDNEPVPDGWQRRTCGRCGKPSTTEGHDGCIGRLPGVRNACCGHGQPGQAYVQFNTGLAISGHLALAFVGSNGH